MKQCTNCKIQKSLDLFYKSKKSRDGYENQCKSCRVKKMNNTRNNRCISSPLLKAKKCGTCEEIKFAKDFFKQKRNWDGLDTICKNCCSEIDYKRNQTDKRRDNKRKYQSVRRKELQMLWLDYFTLKYGDKPKCNVCHISLAWFDSYQYKTVIFDHRLNGSEFISGSPKHWLSANKPTNDNIQKWEECNFGILCDRCNRFLPTKNRLKWLQDVIKYVQETEQVL